MIQRNDENEIFSTHADPDAARTGSRAHDPLGAERVASEADNGVDAFWQDALDRIS